jgi:cytochrome c2
MNGRRGIDCRGAQGKVRLLLVCLPLLLAGCDGAAPAGGQNIGDAENGRRVIARVECGVCHVIPGVSGARGTVGPSLQGFASRNFIAGVVVNEPAVLVQWVRDAPSLAPHTAMPALPIDETEARDVAAYLQGLR